MQTDHNDYISKFSDLKYKNNNEEDDVNDNKHENNL